MTKPKGIHSPWGAEEAPKQEEPRPTKGPTVLKEFSLNKEEVPFTSVNFRGQTYTLRVQVLAQKEDENRQKLAAFVLGKCLDELLTTMHGAELAFARQSIWRKPPPMSKVELSFGQLTLYAAASSTQYDLALKMAIDRVAMALMELRGSDPRASKILANYKVDTTIKA